MNEKKYQVFISSTFSDLVAERDGIIKSILELYHIPIGMEMFSAEDEDQWEIIRRTIEVSDYYVLILGLRYGSKTSEGVGFTQKEYEYAKEIGIPILAFLMNDDVSLSRDKRDDDLKEINIFRETVLRNSKMAQFWSSRDELIKNVSIALMKQIAQKPGVGWVRGDKALSEEALSKELTILSKENRELRDKVIGLESQLTLKQPIIDVHIGDLFVDDRFDSYTQAELPKKLCMNDVDKHLRHYVTEGDIQGYNERIPDQETLDKYNEDMEFYFKVSNCSSPLVIEVSNSGAVKANNIYIDIKFPDGIAIFGRNEEIKEPSSPIPPELLKEAELKYQEDYQRAGRMKARLNPFFDVYNSGVAFKNPSILGHHRLSPINMKWWTSLDEKELTIKIDSLLHTRSMKFDDEYIIVPLIGGKHLIEISMICEEMSAKITQTLELSVNSI